MTVDCRVPLLPRGKKRRREFTVRAEFVYPSKDTSCHNASTPKDTFMSTAQATTAPIRRSARADNSARSRRGRLAVGACARLAA
jgi:hypothetical protein